MVLAIIVSFGHIIIQFLRLLDKLYSSLIKLRLNDIQRKNDVMLNMLRHLRFNLEQPTTMTSKLGKVYSRYVLKHTLNKYSFLRSRIQSLINRTGNELLYDRKLRIVLNILKLNPSLLKHIPHYFCRMLCVADNLYTNSFVAILNTIHLFGLLLN